MMIIMYSARPSAAAVGKVLLTLGKKNQKGTTEGLFDTPTDVAVAAGVVCVLINGAGQLWLGAVGLYGRLGRLTRHEQAARPFGQLALFTLRYRVRICASSGARADFPMPSLIASADQDRRSFCA